MQCLLQTLLTLNSNINSLWCTPTLIASFTSVFSSFTSVNVGKLQYTAVSPLTTGNINPKHHRLRGPRCITKHTCIVTFNNKLIFDWLDGCRHCNQITLSFYCSCTEIKGLSRILPKIQGLLKMAQTLWTASTTAAFTVLQIQTNWHCTCPSRVWVLMEKLQ